MYRCKECGLEYENKPDYCDCGNDEFELIENKAKQKNSDNEIGESEFKTKTVLPASSFVNSNYVQPRKKTFSEQYPILSHFRNTIEPISMTVFCICILLSIYIIFFAWNKTEKNISDNITISENIIHKDIPKIDKIWDNSLPTHKSEIKKVEQKTEDKIIKQITKPITIPVQSKHKTIPQNTITNSTAKKNNTSKTTLKQVKTVTNNTPSVNIKLQEQAKKQAEEANKKALAEKERKEAEAKMIKKLQEEQVKKAKAEKAKQEAASKQELILYKNNLRNTIGSKIDFTKVIGDGSCTVSFRIDSTGKLTNRSFSKQSTNNTLNDAVYNAVMSTPTFNPPPSGYKNEVLNLNIKFSNGNFEISLN